MHHTGHRIVRRAPQLRSAHPAQLQPQSRGWCWGHPNASPHRQHPAGHLVCPHLLMTASSSSSRKTLGLGFPSWGSGVTVPTSTKPKPTLYSPSTASPCLSKPAARPSGLRNRRPRTRTSCGAAPPADTGPARPGASPPAPPPHREPPRGYPAPPPARRAVPARGRRGVRPAAARRRRPSGPGRARSPGGGSAARAAPPPAAARRPPPAPSPAAARSRPAPPPAPAGAAA